MKVLIKRYVSWKKWKFLKVSVDLEIIFSRKTFIGIKSCLPVKMERWAAALLLLS